MSTVSVNLRLRRIEDFFRDPGLDPLDQRGVDPPQLAILFFKPCDLGLQLSGWRGFGCGQWQPR